MNMNDCYFLADTQHKEKAHSLLKKQMTSIEQYLILFCVFLYLFRIFSQNFSYFVFVPVVVDFSLFVELSTDAIKS